MSTSMKAILLTMAICVPLAAQQTTPQPVSQPQIPMTDWTILDNAPPEVRKAWDDTQAERAADIKAKEDALENMQAEYRQAAQPSRRTDRRWLANAKRRISDQKAAIEQAKATPAPVKWPDIRKETAAGKFGRNAGGKVVDVIDARTMIVTPVYTFAFQRSAPVFTGNTHSMTGVSGPPVMEMKTIEADYYVIVQGYPTASASVGDTWSAPAGSFITVAPPATVRKDNGVEYGPIAVWQPFSVAEYFRPAATTTP